MIIKRVRNILGLVMALLMVTGCGSTARVNQFNEFSSAGFQYYKAVNALAAESELALIEKDTKQLVSQRNRLTSKAVRNSLFTKNETELGNTLGEIQQFRLLTTRMQRYFSALSKLSANDVGEGFSDNLNTLAQSLVGANNAFQGVTANADPVKKPGLLANFIVGKLQNSALEDELKTNGKVLDDSLRHTAIYVNQMIDNLSTDRTAEIGLTYQSKVIEPFIALKPLPKDWVKERNRLVQLKARSDLAKTVKEDSEDLHKMYLALANKGTANEEIKNFLVSINGLLEFVDMLKAD